MKNIEDLKKKQGQLDQVDLDKVRSLTAELAAFKDSPEISENGLRKLENILTELEGLKNSYIWRLVKLLKQNHMLD
tara:strand:- start:592 stop:819 length:228 start_codon:yes stop_codon:yes gene_type:complete